MWQNSSTAPLNLRTFDFDDRAHHRQDKPAAPCPTQTHTPCIAPPVRHEVNQCSDALTGAYFRTKDGKLIRLETKVPIQPKNKMVPIPAENTIASPKIVPPNTKRNNEEPLKAILVPKETTNKATQEAEKQSAEAKILETEKRLEAEATVIEAEKKKEEADAVICGEMYGAVAELLSNYDPVIEPSQTEKLDNRVNAMVFEATKKKSGARKKSETEAASRKMFDAENAFNYNSDRPAPSEESVDTNADINVRRVFPNNQGTGLNLLKSMRPTNKVVIVERPVDKSYDFNTNEGDGQCDFASDTIDSKRVHSKCSKSSTIFTNKDLSGAAFGPCFTVCKSHLMGAGHARNNEIVLKNNKADRDQEGNSKRKEKPILWQYLLELLGDIAFTSVARWTGSGLEFKIVNSRKLAGLWGLEKKKRYMNFDKLSRALRYYYKQNLMTHHDTRLLYSFCYNPRPKINIQEYTDLLLKALKTHPCPSLRQTLQSVPPEHTESVHIDLAPTFENSAEPKLTKYVYESMHRHKTGTEEQGTQTSDDRQLLEELYQVDLKEISDERDTLKTENKMLAEEVKSLKSANYTYSQRIKDFDQELSIEKELREFLKVEKEEKEQANQKLQDECMRLLTQTEQLKEEKEEMTKEVEVVKQDNINFKLTNLDKSDTDGSMIEELKRETRYLNKQASIKDKKIKTLQVSVASISEALRQQTKTVCDLSRKSTNVNPEEDSKHKLYVGFESLLKITCNVLGSLQKENEQKIEEPEAMKKLCQMVSGDENLFSLFRKIFSKEGEEEEDTDKEGVEKRVLFLINLMSYFYSGGNESPSSSGLKTLL